MSGIGLGDQCLDLVGQLGGALFVAQEFVGLFVVAQARAQVLQRGGQFIQRRGQRVGRSPGLADSPAGGDRRGLEGIQGVEETIRRRSGAVDRADGVPVIAQGHQAAIVAVVVKFPQQELDSRGGHRVAEMVARDSLQRVRLVQYDHVVVA